MTVDPIGSSFSRGGGNNTMSAIDDYRDEVETIGFFFKSKDCPICLGKLFNIENSESVCDSHQDWIISVCKKCERSYFAGAKDICHQCGDWGYAFDGQGSNHDPRWYLRKIGQESENDYFGTHENYRRRK